MEKQNGKHGGRWKEIFKYFGVKRKDRTAIRDALPEGAKAKTLYKALKKQTGKKKGIGFLEFASSKPTLFKKATKKYNNKTGTPSVAQTEIAEQEAQEAADESQAVDKGLSEEYIAEQERRQGEGYDTSVTDSTTAYNRSKESADTSYNRFTTDIESQKGIGSRKYNDQLANDQLQALLETQGATGDINAAGQWNSSLRDTRLSQLAQQQNSRSGNIKNTYQDYLNNLNTLSTNQAQDYNTLTSQQSQDYNTQLQKYQRQKDQGLFDLDYLDRQRDSEFAKQNEQYVADYVGDYNQNIADQSQTYYDRQEATANDAANFTQDLYSAGT